MNRYVMRRLLLVPVTLFIASVLMFAMLRAIPGDVVTMLFGEAMGGGGDAEHARRLQIILREELGLTRPHHVQYFDWVKHLVTLDFGRSFYYQQPVMDVLKARLPPSFEIMVIAIAIGTTLGLSAGIFSAVRQDSWFDYVVRIIAVSGLSMPAFVSAALLLVILISVANWTPSPRYYSLLEDPIEHLKIIIWPALVLGYIMAASIARLTRTQVLEIIREDYVRTARAKGLRELHVINRHVLKNAMVPIISLLGLQVALLISGSVVVEQIFNIPGMGQGLLTATVNRDYSVLQLFVIMIVLFVLIINLAVDMAYAWIDPRVKYE